MDGRFIVLRIRLWVALRDRFDVRWRERPSSVFDGMFIHHPVNQKICQVNNGLLGTSRLGHIHAWVLSNELSQEFRRGSRKRFENRLIRIPHAHPVAVGTGKQTENILLQAARVLCFIFENKWKAITDTLEILLIYFEDIERQSDEIVEVHSGAIREGALVIEINFQSQLG